jgi:hypothetical protein
MFVKWIIAGAAAVLGLGCGMFVASDRVGYACACVTPEDEAMPIADATTLDIRSFVAAGAEGPFVISDRDVLLAAMLMMDQYKADAIREESARADRRAEEGDMASAAAWHRILDKIERMQAVERQRAKQSIKAGR